MATFKNKKQKLGKGHEVKSLHNKPYERARERESMAGVVGVCSCFAGTIWMMPSEPMRLCGLNLRPLRVPAFTSLLECYRYGPWNYYSISLHVYILGFIYPSSFSLFLFHYMFLYFHSFPFLPNHTGIFFSVLPRRASKKYVLARWSFILGKR